MTRIVSLMSVMVLLGMDLSAAVAPEEQFLTRARQLTFEGQRSGEGYFDANGKALIFQSEREPGNPFYQIYTLDLESGETRRVSPGHGKTTCGFLRPGRDELLFASTHLDRMARDKQKAEIEFRTSGKQRRYSWDYDDQMEIYAARRDGSGLRRLTMSDGYDAEAAYSPDGSKIVFCSLRSAYPTNRLSAADLKRLETAPAYFGEIYIMNADGSGQRRLTTSPGYDGGPFFSPDGQRIVWRHFDTNGVIADVYTMKLDGSDVRRVTDFASMSWAPFFHPSGEYIVFTANKQGFGNFELFIVDAAGTREPVRVTHTDGFDGLPSFSPDGQQLTWTSTRGADAKSQIFLAQWNHAAAQSALAGAPPRGQRTNGNDVALAGSGTTTTSSTLLPALRESVTTLASAEFEGRMTGEKGAQLAAEFIAGKLGKLGLKSAGATNNYFQPFEFNAGARVRTNDNRIGLVAGGRMVRFVPERDFRPLSFTSNGAVSGEVVFAGYGLTVPGKGTEGYDSYRGLDVSNKIVLALRYVPEQVEPKRRQELNRYAGLRYKAMLARERGAKAILFVTGPTSPTPGELASLNSDSSSGSGSGIIAASVSTNIAESLLTMVGRGLKSVQAQLDKEDPHAEGGFVISNVTLSLTASVEHIRKTDRNVIAVLPPAGSAEYVLVGAHYDHLGFGESGAMRRSGEEDKIHPGADDNASGTAGLLELARMLALEQAGVDSAARRGIIFAFWSGEELGLLGSSWFAEHSPVPLSNIVACLNFDMIGRLRDNKLMLQGVGSSTWWRRTIEKRNVAAAFDLVLQEDPYLPTDVTAFYPRGIPVLSFFTGSHDDYHRPTDTADKVDYAGVERIVRLARGIVVDVTTATERPDYVKVATSDKGMGSRENLRAYLGTIPDYATETAGVKLSGVRGGSPAEKAGLKSGDVIVEFGGQKIANIYDYTYALDAVKIGQPVQVVVLRDGQRVTVQATPEARK
jgi:Tol biopolymer transport system component